MIKDIDYFVQILNHPNIVKECVACLSLFVSPMKNVLYLK